MQKIYPNDPCPCGSGLKFKKCKCEQYHPGRSSKGIVIPEELKALGLRKAEEDAFLTIAGYVEDLYQKEKDLYDSSLKVITPNIIKEDRPIAVSRYDEAGDRVVFSSGLIARYLSLVEERFPDAITGRFFKKYSGADARRVIFEAILKVTTLHEYYHWFRGHADWGSAHNQPPVDANAAGQQDYLQQRFIFNLKQQCVEYDADRYAVNMFVKMMSEKAFTEEDILCVLLAFSTITGRADQDQSAGKGFDFSNYEERLIQTHPLPSVRFYYLQRNFLRQIEKAGLFKDFEKAGDAAVSAAYEIEKAIAASAGRGETGSAFMDTAHTEKALEWHAAVVSNLRKLAGEIAAYSEINYLGEPEMWESAYSGEDVWFADDGAALRR